MFKEEKKFTIIFLFNVVLILAVILFLSIWVDPRAFFGTGKFMPLVITARPSKLELIRKASPPPEIFILGSSSVFRINPDEIKKMTGRNAFNFGVGNGKPEEYLAFTSYAMEDLGIKPKMLIIGVDHDAFDAAISHPVTINTKVLNAKLDIGKLQYLRVMLFTLRENLTLQYIADIFKVLRFSLFGYPENAQGFRDNGCTCYQNSARVPDVFGEKDKNAILPVYKEAQGVLASWRKDYFKKLLDVAKQESIQVKVVLMPTHPLMLKELKQMPEFNEMHKNLIDFFEKFRKEYNYNFYDFTEISSFDGNPHDFADSVHILDENADKILKLILDDSASN